MQIEIGDIYMGKQVTEVRREHGATRIFAVEGTLPESTLMALRAYFKLPAGKRGFMFRPGTCIATVEDGD
jgi:hypothetical protein